MKDVCVQNTPQSRKTSRSWCTCDLTVDVGQMQSITCQVFLDLSRSDRANREIAWFGVTVTTYTSTRHNCGKRGAYARNYVKSKRKNRTK